MLTDLIELETIVESVDGSTVTLADATGLAVGDRIIIESEHGYNEPGLDGEFPPLYGPESTFYYRRSGKSFFGTVIAISGTAVTLDRAVPPAAAGKNFYRDNYAAVKYALENLLPWPNAKRFAVACDFEPLYYYLSNDYAEIDFNHCEIFSPRGCPSVRMTGWRLPQGAGGLSNKTYRNLILRGNARTVGYAIHPAIPIGFYCVGTSGGDPDDIIHNITIENFTLIDNFSSIAIQLAKDVVVRNCVAKFTDHQKAYLGTWQFTAADCRGGIRFENCRIDSDFVRDGFEAFRSSSGTQFNRCGGRNCIFAVNSSGDVDIDDCSVVWDQENPDPSFSKYESILSVNRNIDNQSGESFDRDIVRVKNFSTQYNAIPYPEEKCILPNICSVAGAITDVRGATLRVPKDSSGAPRTDVVSRQTQGYVVRSDDPKSRASGLVWDALATGAPYVKVNVPSNDDPLPETTTRAADLALTWAPSTSPGVIKQRLTIKVDGSEKANKEIPSNIDVYGLSNVKAGSEIEYAVYTIGADGQETPSQPFTFRLGNLIAVKPATNLGYTLIKTYDLSPGEHEVIAKPTSRPVASGVATSVVNPGASSLKLPTGAWLDIPFDESAGIQARNKAAVAITTADLGGYPEQNFLYFGSPSGITDLGRTDPNGGSNASRWVKAAGNNYFGPQSGFGLPAGTYTASIWAKSNGVDTTLLFRTYDNGVLTSQAGHTVSGTWARFSTTFTIGTSFTGMLISNDGSSAVDMDLYGLQIEPGSSASAYPSVDWQAFLPAANAPSWNSRGLSYGSTAKMAVSVSRNRPKSLTACTFYAVAKQSGTPANNAYLTLIVNTPNTGSPTLRLGGAWAQANGPMTWQIGGIASAGRCRARLDDSAYHVLAWSCNGSIASVYMDGTLIDIQTGTMGALTVDRLYYGWLNNTAWAGELNYIAGYDSAHDASTVRTATDYLHSTMARRGITVGNLAEVVVFEGDSISGGSDTTYANVSTLAPATKIVNFAVPGSRMIELNARASTVDLVARTNAKPILSVLIGRNDLAGFTASEYLASLKTYCLARRAAGYKIIVCTVLPSTEAGYNTARNALNALIVGDTSFYDVLCDFASDPTMGPDAAASDTTYYSDGTHPTAAGHLVLEAVSKTAIQAAMSL